MEELFAAWAGKLGLGVQLVAIVGSLRLFFKPIMTGLEKFVKWTPFSFDDKLPEKLRESKIYKMAVYFFDYLASIK